MEEDPTPEPVIKAIQYMNHFDQAAQILWDIEEYGFWFKLFINVNFDRYAKAAEIVYSHRTAVYEAAREKSK